MHKRPMQFLPWLFNFSFTTTFLLLLLCFLWCCRCFGLRLRTCTCRLLILFIYINFLCTYHHQRMVFFHFLSVSSFFLSENTKNNMFWWLKLLINNKIKGKKATEKPMNMHWWCKPLKWKTYRKYDTQAVWSNTEIQRVPLHSIHSKRQWKNEDFPLFWRSIFMKFL